ncbi:pentapeptide repeat-containing protein [Streptomyces wedmorensis]|uniref:pentapeptide repeat-containing protein n=1 Tax=Streptomyces wedmorensis TaxID=43759 RepID=UPI0037A8FB54
MGQTKDEIRLAEHGQITNRFNVAVQNLGSKTLDVRLGGIYALQRIMQDSTRDQPTIVAVLSAYVREHAPDPKGAHTGVDHRPPTDIQAAVNVLAGRNPAPDADAVVDLQFSDLRAVRLDHPRLGNADLAYSDLRFAVLSHADLSKAHVSHTSLNGADLADSQLSEADLRGSTLIGSRLMRSDLRRADLTGAELADARLAGANLARANLAGANLAGTNRTRTKFTTPEDMSFPINP